MVDTEHLALSMNAGVGNALDPTVFTFGIQPRSGVDPAATEKVLYEEPGCYRRTRSPTLELRKAKNQILGESLPAAEDYRGPRQPAGQLRGVLRRLWAKLATADKDIEAVTAGDIQRVARAVFYG